MNLSLFLSIPQGADGLYTGFIKVHLRLSRPVTVLAVEGTGLDGQAERRPMTVSEGQEGAGAGFSEKRTSFYLPSDCVKQIHISSTTTVREVIQGLLKKFMVQDNPRKFALYRQTHRDGQGELRTQITRIQWGEQVFETLPIWQVFLLTKHVEVCNFYKNPDHIV